MQPKIDLFRLALVVVSVCQIGFSSFALAKGKVDMMFGAFSLAAKTSRESATVSGIGAYQLVYRYPFIGRLEFSFAYSLIASKVFTGDLGYGPDIGLVYYPFTNAAPVTASSENVQFQFREYYKPFVGVAFHQRQFQSTQSSYAGFSLSLGSEYSISEITAFKGELRYMNLSGPSQAKATEIDLLMGLSFRF